MKIIIRDEGKKRTIPIPNFILTSKFIIRKIAKESKLEDISKKQIRQFAKGLKKIRKQFKGLLLVDVEEKNGAIVKIYL